MMGVLTLNDEHIIGVVQMKSAGRRQNEKQSEFKLSRMSRNNLDFSLISFLHLIRNEQKRVKISFRNKNGFWWCYAYVACYEFKRTQRRSNRAFTTDVKSITFSYKRMFKEKYDDSE